MDYLKTVKQFLDANPNEVITFIFTNPDRASIPGLWKTAFDQSGKSRVLVFNCYTLTVDTRYYTPCLRSSFSPSETIGLADSWTAD